jgi:mono/diheme cytochrome c family protein
MKTTSKYLLLVVALFILGCGGKERKKKNGFSYENKKTENTNSHSNQAKINKNVDLNNKGIGPITSVSLDTEINKSLAKQGKTIFKLKCASCHRTHKKFTGPPMAGILNRRSPEWIMNMILNPIQMVKEDALAKALFIEYNTSIMGNQNLSEQDTRALLEYFRTLN